MPYLGKSPTSVPLVTADLTDDMVTLAKMAGGTDGNLITYDASGNPAAVAAGTSGHYLKSQGAGSVPVFAAVTAGGTLTASQDVVSGSSVDFTGIPAGTKWITVQVENVSTNGTGNIYIQIGDSGGIETSGYLGALGGVLNTSAHGSWWTGEFKIVNPTSAASGYSGIVHLRLKESSGNIWVCSSGGIGATNNASDCDYMGGHKPLSAELTQLRFGTSDTFDSTFAGSVSIQYGA